MKKTIFIKNALILTVTSLILRFAGIIFKVRLASVMGSEGIGLYQLIFSVYVLASTFASGGISTAVTRLIAEELSLGTKKGCIKIFNKSIILTIFVAVISSILLYFGADFIAIRLLGDQRAVIPIKILPLSLPFVGVTSCFRGYFIARRSATPNAISQILEQAVRIILITVLVENYRNQGIKACCIAVVIGDVVAEISAFLLLFILFEVNKRSITNLSGRKRPPYPIFKRLSEIAVPITSGRYLNSLLRTAENILVPKNIAKFALSGESALSQFGMIKGMALPILFFPSAILNSISTLLIPEMTEASAKNQKWLVKSATHNTLKLTSLIGFIFGAIFFTAGDQIGILIYKSEDVGFLLRSLSPIVPLMYLDSISDGILKGLDQQVFSFRTAISDSVIRIILILIIIPKTGILGFIGIMYFSNFLTCFLNVGRLINLSEVELKPIKEIFMPCALSSTICLLTNFFLKEFTNFDKLVYIILLSSISLLFYIIFLLYFGVLEKEEILHYIKK